MENKITIIALSLLIALLSSIACLIGLISDSPGEPARFTSVHGQEVELYGKGIYKNDSVSVVAQGKAQDGVTLGAVLVLAAAAIVLGKRETLRLRLLLCGVTGYFLYSFISYVFLWNLNPLFLIYVAIMSLSFFSFLLQMKSLSPEEVKGAFSEKTPVRFFGFFQIILAAIILLMWLKLIMPVFTGGTPEMLEHYTTLVIQGMDLGFVAPLAFLSGLWILRRKPWGYLLTAIVMIKGASMFLAIFAMIVNMYRYGTPGDPVTAAVFTLFTLFGLGAVWVLFRNLKVSTGEEPQSR